MNENPIKTFNDWQSAAESCKQRKAISDPFPIRLDGGRVLDICIVKPLRGDPEYVYSSCPAIRVKGLDKPRAADCDKIKRWKPW